jgi:hypothetical protein
MREFSHLQSVQTGSEAHPAPDEADTAVFFPGLKRPGCEAGHSPRSSADVKNGEVILPLYDTSS